MPLAPPAPALTGLLGAGFVLARALGADGIAAADLVLLAALAALPGPGRERGTRRALLGGLAALAAAGAALLPPAARARALDALPCAANLVLALHFAATLRPGREPLIARYTRLDRGAVPPECEGYARGLTAFWAGLLLLLALVHALALAGALALPGGVLLAANLAAVATAFLAEHLIRTLRFPHLGTASPLRTCRAMLRAGGQGAAAAAPAPAPDRRCHAG
ncbi:COG4648 family protein [Caldovatus aquaticus]|uniref:Uncharacterized protein n=1 Tax=Caldovatus aquaticus TaxID=2865671 RepID=A0ABS7F6X3_9PROT|nr:hypothetical protein [Caldovatus aquaticus]MBW8271304.1 hypothetical protein [Caldovatus aquaticus]